MRGDLRMDHMAVTNSENFATGGSARLLGAADSSIGGLGFYFVGKIFYKKETVSADRPGSQVAAPGAAGGTTAPERETIHTRSSREGAHWPLAFAVIVSVNAGD